MSRTIPLLVMASLSLASSFAVSTDVGAARIPCTAGPLCGPPPGKPGDDNPGGDNPDPGGWILRSGAPLIDCRVSGDPELLPDDLKFRNIGGVVIPAGTRVYWIVKATGDHGYYFVEKDIQPGKEIAKADILSVGTPPHDNCRSIIM